MSGCLRQRLAAEHTCASPPTNDVCTTGITVPSACTVTETAYACRQSNNLQKDRLASVYPTPQRGACRIRCAVSSRVCPQGTMDKISKVALLAAAAAGVAAGVLYVAASAASSRPSNAADREGDDMSAGADSPGQRESERPPAPPRRTRAGAGGAGAGSAIGRTRKDSATRKNSWAEPLYAREDGASGLNTKATSVVDDMLRKARDQVDLLQDQAAQLYIPTPRRRSRRHSVTRGPARKPSEATRKAVLQ